MDTDFTTLQLPTEISPENFAGIQRRCSRIFSKGNLRIDGKSLVRLDFLGESLLASLQTRAEELGRKLLLAGFSPELKSQISRITRHDVPVREPESKMGPIERLGDRGFFMLEGFRTFFYLLSESLYWTFFKPFDKNRIPFGGTALQLLRLGSEATGIVFLLVFLIAFTLAVQSAGMLNAVGAASYLSSGLGFFMFAEIGPLLTSIILAGRSGSSITAEIASMTVAEEVKALKTMGIPPVQYLILPKFKAMCIAVPILSFCSSILGCLAGLIVGDMICEVSPINYILSLKDGINLVLIVKSMIKSVVFAWIITLVAAQKGLNVRGGADSVGKATTDGVVTSITGIIIADAILALVFY